MAHLGLTAFEFGLRFGTCSLSASLSGYAMEAHPTDQCFNRRGLRTEAAKPLRLTEAVDSNHCETVACS